MNCPRLPVSATGRIIHYTGLVIKMTDSLTRTEQGAQKLCIQKSFEYKKLQISRSFEYQKSFEYQEALDTKKALNTKKL